MLRVFRDYMKYLSWVLWTVIAVFILFVFVDFGSAVGPVTSTGAEPAATVGGEVISMEDFQSEYKRLERQYRQFGNQIPQEQLQQMLPMQALNRLVSRRIQMSEAEAMGLEASADDLRAEILSYPDFTDEKGKFVGQEMYEKIVRRRYGYPRPEAFEALVRQDIVLRRLQSTLASTVWVSDESVERQYREEAEKATIRFAELPYSEVAGDVDLTEEATLDYFENHRDLYKFDERRVVDYLLVSKAVLRNEIEPTDEELQAYYDANSGDFRQDEQVRARHILVKTSEERSEAEAERESLQIKSRLEAGEDFAALAAELSEDPGSKTRGGDLGFFGRGRMLAPFENAAFGAEIGQVIGPVKTNFGFHLIEVQEKREERDRPLDEVKGIVKARVQTEKADALAKERAEEIVANLPSDADAETMKALAEGQNAVQFQTTTPFAEGTVVPQVGRAPEFMATTFTLELGEISGTITMPRGYAILRLKKIEEPRLADFTDVENEVKRDARQFLEKELAVQRLEAVRATVQAGGDFETEAEALGLNVRTSDSFGSSGQISGLGFNKAVADAALALEPGSYGEAIAGDRGAVLFEVVAREHASDEDFLAKKDELRDQLVGQEVNSLLSSIIEQKRQELGVTYGRTLLENFNLLDEGAEGTDS